MDLCAEYFVNLLKSLKAAVIRIWRIHGMRFIVLTTGSKER